MKFLCWLNNGTHTHPFNGPFSRTTWVGRYQKGKTNLDFTKARDSEWQWHQLGLCKSAPRSRQITTPAPHHSVFLQAGCPSCRPNNSVKALKANSVYITCLYKIRIKHSYVMQHLLFLRCWFPARFQNAWNAFNRNLTDTISEARQAWIDLPQLFPFPLCQLTHNLKHMIWTHLMH